jgi:hypothetical protein
MQRAVELLYWDGCPSHSRALAELREALDELGRADVEITAIEVATESEAKRRGFIGSPSLRIAGADPLPPPPGEPTGLSCRVYRLRDGRFSPTPDPADLRDALRRLLPSPAKEP